MANELDPNDSMGALYGKRLRGYRLEAGWTQSFLGRKVHVVGSRITQLERAVGAKPTLELSRRLDTALATDGLLTELTPHVRREAFPDFARRHLDREAVATTIRSYMSSTVHGLLQTEAYARALLSESVTVTSPEHLEERVAARMERQTRLTDPSLRAFWLVLDEAVLMRSLGGRPAMREQLARLLYVAHDSRVTLQVLPFEAGGHPSIGNSLTLLSVPDGSESAYQEGFDFGQLYEEKREVALYTRAYDQIRALALPPHLSLDLIRSVMEGHHRAARVPTQPQRRRLAGKQLQQRGGRGMPGGGGRGARRAAGPGQ